MAAAGVRGVSMAHVVQALPDQVRQDAGATGAAPVPGVRDALPADEQDSIGSCLAGGISPQVALSRLLLGGAGADAIAEQVESRRPPGDAAQGRHAAWRALSGLLEGRGTMLARLAGEVARLGGNHAALAGGDGVAPGGRGPAQGAAKGIAAFFDQAVAFSPEASVALYSLGDPAILAAATREIVEWLHGQGCVGPGMDVLDLGCGIGRLAMALAPGCRSVLGLDVSTGMVAEARRRCAPWPGISIEPTDGTSLDALPSAGFDLVLAVDSFPYLVQVGPAALATHVRGAGRILRPGGRLVILNLSFGRGLATDRADLQALAVECRLAVELDGTRPFALWDGTAFILRRPLEPESTVFRYGAGP